jgi:hypothetical protein
MTQVSDVAPGPLVKILFSDQKATIRSVLKVVYFLRKKKRALFGAVIPYPSSFLGGGLERATTPYSPNGTNAGMNHSCNTFDHSKDFLAFFTSSTLLINVSRSIHKYRIRYLHF